MLPVDCLCSSEHNEGESSILYSCPRSRGFSIMEEEEH